MINFDQASSAFPKAPGVADAVAQFINTGASNINRGSLSVSYEAAKLVLKFREYLLEFFGAKNKHAVFTKNITESLNILLCGYLKNGDHVIISGLEHNAVMRPLHHLSRKCGVSYSIMDTDTDGIVDPKSIKRLVQPSTKAIITTAASNVCGTILPIKTIGAIAKELEIPYFLDSAQLAGFLPINMDELGIDALALTGHKGLLGPQGIGALLLSEDLANNITPLIYGGTGSISDSYEMPELLSEKFEAGTLNLPGIAGLAASIGWLKNNQKQLIKHEVELTSAFLEQLAELPVRLVGIKAQKFQNFESRLADAALQKYGQCAELLQIVGRTPTISIDTLKIDAAELAYYLDSEHKISTRVGMHCAPLAHRTLGTFPKGTVRFSIGYANTTAEIECCLNALKTFFALKKT